MIGGVGQPDRGAVRGNSKLLGVAHLPALVNRDGYLSGKIANAPTEHLQIRKHGIDQLARSRSLVKVDSLIERKCG